MCESWQHKVAAVLGESRVNPRGDPEKSSVAYCSYKNHNYANIGNKNMNYTSFYR